MKSQDVRLLDVFLLGPFMMWYASQAHPPQWATALMIGFGILTIAYNGANFLAQEKQVA